MRENKSLLLVRDCAVILVSKKHPIDKLTELRALLVKIDNAIRLETADLYLFKTSKDEREFQQGFGQRPDVGWIKIKAITSDQ